MAQFRYTGVDAEGREVSGELEAAGAEAAREQLRALGCRPTHLVPVVPAAVAAEQASAGGERLRTDDLAEVGGRVIDVTRAGLPLAAGLRALASEVPSRRLRRLLTGISDRLEAGEPLDAVLATHRGRVPGYLHLLVQAGLHSGQLGLLLERYLNFSRAAVDHRRRAGLGLAYPLVLIAAGLGICAFFLIGLVPEFGKIFEDFGTELPTVTLAMLSLSEFLAGSWHWILLGLLVVAGYVPLMATLIGGAAGRRRALFAVPLIGGMWRDAALSQFCHLLALLIENQVPLPTALRTAGRATNDALVEQVSHELAVRVEHGGRLGDTIPIVRSLSPLLSPVLRWESRGDAFPEVLHGAGEVFATRASVQASLIGILTEPLVVTFVAVLTGFVVISMFMPLIRLLKLLS